MLKVKNENSKPAIERIGLSAAESASLIGVARSTFLLLNSSGRVPLPRRLGGRVLWDKRELESWFAAGCPIREKWENMKKENCD
jgi:predicted DNA-binding transcriptional regulator AlpA